ncbi:universal stress protein [Dyadobacter sp. NIV53]|uniref:universal stress protein n=1 Tax=Dyadobacter sp. NIV53 TaxID=2861765 RepID=UPI001C8703F9|nr:universal stress protein [Dyadobacter sp. NIV53]
MKKILVPCDFSDEAMQAYKFAWDIASANDGELIVLHVVDLTLFLTAVSMRSLIMLTLEPHWQI